MLCGVRTSRKLQQHGSNRLLSVVAWGRNAEGQCGVKGGPLITEPAELDALAGQDIACLAAGSLHSGAVLRDGQVFTWGSGKAGKLGHGVTDDFKQPTRIEALVGRADMQMAALGNSHSLFLDKTGGVWSCGENKEGQCGLGTPLEMLAKQRRQEWTINSNMATFAQAYAEATQPSADSQMSSDGGGYDGQQQSRVYSAGHHLKPFINRSAQEAELERSRELFAGASMQATESDSSFGTFAEAAQSFSGRAVDGAALAASMFGRMGGIMPGQHHTPIRIGRDLHPLLAQHGSGDREPAGGDAALQGIAAQNVTGIAASRYFSILRTTSGEVWTCGGGFNGELGQASSWLTSASQVTGPVREAIAENGGAIAVECGSTFGLALTASGVPVIWGGLPGAMPAPGARRSGGVMAAEVMGLPPISAIAAGHSHMLMTDGQRVWIMGTWLRNGRKDGTKWGEPQEVRGLPGCGVARIATGARASAAVMQDGSLWMWGRLMAEDNARALVQQASGRAASKAEAARWMWKGIMGSDTSPVRVPGLGRVTNVQLGAAHALCTIAD